MIEGFPPGRRPCAIVYLAKRGRRKYLSHLDLARAMDRAVRRAKLPVAYSQGFHPHARISFAQPLPLGMEGLREVCCLELSRVEPVAEMTRALGRELPAGLELVSLEITSRGRRSPLADLVLAEYEIYLAGPEPVVALGEAVTALLSAPEWPTERQTKRQLKTVDIRPGLRRLELRTEPEPHLVMELSAAPGDLVKPAEVLQALAELAGLPNLETTRWVRTHLR